MQAKDRLIVALDGDWELDELLKIAGSLSGEIGMVKVGKRNFTRFGPEVIKGLNKLGLSIFLDLKFHDIPNTVAQACEAAVALNVKIINVHASGGEAMMKRAREAVDETAKRLNVTPPLLIAVTVLTSMDQEQLKLVGIETDVKEQVARLAKLAKSCKLDGVVASAKEVGIIREAVGDDFLVVTPGIRPAGAVKNDDQSRVLTPAKAVEQGVDYIVVGRPVYGAESPLEASRMIVSEMAKVS